VAVLTARQPEQPPPEKQAMESEADLLYQAKAFDLQALAAIYDRYSPALYAYALRLLGDESLAEDCVAETFSRFLKTLRAGQGPDHYLQAYLYRVAHNWITDVYRRQPPPPFELDEALCVAEEQQPEAQLQQHMQQAQVRAALRALTPDQRQVVMLRFFEGLSNEAVAYALQKPVSAVKALQHRALAALRKWLVVDVDLKDEDYAYQ
jgi:RNA polymerase sigma-70 factor, ECF subfamily